jgi:hypothetical protein
MTATFDVEAVLKRLNNVEKVSLLSGLHLQEPLPVIHITKNKQELTGGIPSLFPNMASQQFVSLTVRTESVVPSSSMA